MESDTVIVMGIVCSTYTLQVQVLQLSHLCTKYKRILNASSLFVPIAVSNLMFYSLADASAREEGV